MELFDTSLCASEVLTRLMARIRRVRPEYRNFDDWCLLHDNAPSQTSLIVLQFLALNKPSTMKTTSVMQSPHVVRPPPLSMSMDTSLTGIDSPTTVLNYATTRTSSSSSSLKSMSSNSPIMPHRFVQPTKTPPSTFITGNKGTKYEISGPANFAHVSGDMTRDMTRNAFDLTLTMKDNVLKKYLMERGIKEEDIYGMRKQDLIRNIVQSQYTWVPSKSRQYIKKEFKRMNTMTDDKDQPLTLTKCTSSPIPSVKSPQNTDLFSDYALVNGRFAEPPYTPSTPSPKQNRDPFSSYAMINSRFADPSEFPSPHSLNNTLHVPDFIAVSLPPLPPQAVRPAPPPRNSKIIQNKVQAPPPPPSTIKATVNISPDVYHSSIGFESNNQSKTEQTLIPVTTLASKTMEDLYANPKLTVKPIKLATEEQSSSQMIALLPKSKLTVSKETSPSYYKPVQSNSNKKSFGVAALPPPPPPPPPPPMQMLKTISRAPSPPMQAPKTISDVPSPPPPPMQMPNKISGAPPPLQPPMQILHTVSGSLIRAPAPLMQITKSGSGAPLPPPMIQLNKNPTPTLDRDTANEGDAKDDFLESIRKGITLKKVDKKASTVIGIKPRSERKPPVADFLSELRMGITLRRAKNPADNPFAENDADESNV